MRILLFIVMGGLVGCGGNAAEDPSKTGAQQQGGGMPGVSGSGSGSVSGSGGAPGMAGVGGTMSVAGGGGEAGVPTDCGGSVTFGLIGGTPPGPPKRYCLGKPGTCSGGPGVWLTLTGPSGEVVAIERGCYFATCSECRPAECPLICGVSSPLPEAGVEVTWGGVSWNTQGMCDEDIACRSPACAAPGRYTARMCGFELTGTASVDNPALDCETNAADEPTCVTVEFDWPMTGTLQGVFQGVID